MSQTLKKALQRSMIVILFFLIANATLFAYPASSSEDSHTKLVVLIHGLMRTSSSMKPLGHFLERQGYRVYFYGYISARGTIQQHSADLNQFIQNVFNEHQHDQIYFITHSLGGIIARDALAHLSPKQLKHVGGLIMLAPPNQGSSLAKLSLILFPAMTYFVKPLAELSSEKTALVHQIPIPKIKIGIIAGRYDAKVRPKDTYLEGHPEPTVVNSTHTFIMNNTKTRVLVSRFLKNGSFREDS